MRLFCSVLFTGRNISDKSCTEYQNPHFLFFFSAFVTFMRKCGKICRAGQATDDNIMRRMRLARRIIETTDTHSEYIVLTAFPQQIFSLRERATLSRDTYICQSCRKSLIIASCGRVDQKVSRQCVYFEPHILDSNKTMLSSLANKCAF